MPTPEPITHSPHEVWGVPVEEMGDERPRVVRRANSRTLPADHRKLPQSCPGAPATTWNYVPTELKPADIATRAADVRLLKHQCTWLEGPQWLSLPSHDWPRSCHHGAITHQSLGSIDLVTHEYQTTEPNLGKNTCVRRLRWGMNKIYIIIKLLY